MGLNDAANALAVSPNGSTVFVTGTSYGIYYAAYATVAYDATTGARLWVSRFEGPGHSSEAGDVGVSPDGSTVFVTGVTIGLTGSNDYATVAYDAATGARLWLRRYNGPGNLDDYASDLEVSPDGSTVFVTGSSTKRVSAHDYATLAYDAATGARLWISRYNGRGNGYDDPVDLGVSPDGSTVFVTGSSAKRSSAHDYATVAYDAATGAQLWVRRYNGPSNLDDGAFALGVSPDGSTVFVTGGSFGSASSDDAATVAYDAVTGRQLWIHRYNGPGNSNDYAVALGMSRDGSMVFVTGSSVGSASFYDYATVAYDAVTGMQLWVRRYKGPGTSADIVAFHGLSLDASTVFVTGRTQGPTGYVYATVAYDAATGVELWVHRYDGRGSSDSEPHAVGVTPDGSAVFVTGFSEGPTDNTVYATVAYEGG